MTVKYIKDQSGWTNEENLTYACLIYLEDGWYRIFSDLNKNYTLVKCDDKEFEE